MIRLLFDEHLEIATAHEMRRLDPEYEVMRIDPGAPALGTGDPEILCWCEDHESLLVTNDKRTMPGHLADHLAAGRHIPGIILFTDTLSIGRVLEELLLLPAAKTGELRDTITWLPLP
ncbi:MAG: DUF5615 family PIN-like protein [Candidatus Xenobia bacterium]